MNGLILGSIALSACLCAALTMYCVVGIVWDAFLTPKMRVRRKLGRMKISAYGADASDQRNSLQILKIVHLIQRNRWGRVLLQTFNRISDLVAHETALSLRRLIVQTRAEDHVSEQEALCVVSVFAVISGFALSAIGMSEGFLVAGVLFVCGFLVGARLPAMALNRRKQHQQKASIRELPEMIDMVVLASEAGMSFDQALSEYVEQFDTVLAQEFQIAQRSWVVGVSTRLQALDTLAERLEQDAITRFVSVTKQAFELGSPLAPVLENQAIEARGARKAAVEESIAKVSVKMLIPMGLLILPAMLILLLGPILMQVISGMTSY